MNRMAGDITKQGDRILLRKLKVSDITQKYVDWLNDPEVSRFLSIRGSRQTMEMVRDYVRSFENVDNRLLLGIFDRQSGEHIGNITFSSIEWKNEVGIIGIAIGDKAYWGRGFATEALKLSVDHAFTDLKLHKLEAGVSMNNLSSRKLFEKIGFVKEGILKDREKIDGSYVDGIMYGLINE